MKKVLSIFLLLVMCFSFAGCSSNDSDTKSDSKNYIDLTFANYEDYLEFSLKYSLGGTSQTYGFGKCYSDLQPDVKISGATSNYIFNNVDVAIRFFGTYYSYPYSHYNKTPSANKIELDETITIHCNVGGNGTYSTPIKLIGLTTMDSLNIAYEVVSVSGSVTPV